MTIQELHALALRTAQSDYDFAVDNARRARASFYQRDLTQLYGASGKTCGEILAEYEAAEARTKRQLAEVESYFT